MSVLDVAGDAGRGAESDGLVGAEGVVVAGGMV